MRKLSQDLESEWNLRDLLSNNFIFTDEETKVQKGKMTHRSDKTRI